MRSASSSCTSAVKRARHAPITSPAVGSTWGTKERQRGCNTVPCVMHAWVLRATYASTDASRPRSWHGKGALRSRQPAAQLLLYPRAWARAKPLRISRARTSRELSRVPAARSGSASFSDTSPLAPSFSSARPPLAPRRQRTRPFFLCARVSPARRCSAHAPAHVAGCRSAPAMGRASIRADAQLRSRSSPLHRHRSRRSLRRCQSPRAARTPPFGPRGLP